MRFKTGLHVAQNATLTGHASQRLHPQNMFKRVSGIKAAAA